MSIKFEQNFNGIKMLLEIDISEAHNTFDSDLVHYRITSEALHEFGDTLLLGMQRALYDAINAELDPMHQDE